MRRCVFLLAGLFTLYSQPPSTKLWFRGIPMTAEYVNGEWVAGDMILDAPSISFETPAKSQDRAATLYLEASARWPGNVIPYDIAPSVSSRSSADILRAIEHWNQKTPIRFVRRTNENDFISFGSPSDRYLCNSRVGRVGGAQVINIGEFCGYGAVIHEIGHAVGFFHEHQRTDRDRFIKIDTSKVQPGINFDANYGKSPFSRDFGFYDYRSIMHYAGDEIETIPYGIPLDSEELSFGDIDAVERLVQRPRTAYTIESNPAGLQLLVDGRACTSPCRFTTWSEGSSHTIAVTPTQTLRSRTWHFARWSDEGAQSHVITAGLERGVYTANFVKYQPNTLADGKLDSVIYFAPSFAPGVPFTVSPTYSNDGGADLPASSIGFFFSATANGAASGLRATGTCPTDLLRPGGQLSKSCAVRVPDSIRQGEYYLSAIFDPDSKLTEQRRDNNIALAPVGPFFVRGVNGKADLTLSGVTVTGEARPGESISVTASISNRGALATAFRIGYFFSQQPARTAASIPSPSNCAVAFVAERASRNCTTNVTVPATLTPGPWYLIAAVDDLDQVAEEDETNNTRAADSGPLMVRAALPARLEVTAVTAPARGVAGKTLRIETRLRNTGGLPSEPVTVRFRFRSATEPEAPFLPAESVCVIETAIAPQSAAVCAQDIALPEAVAPGWWIAYAAIDGSTEPVASNAFLLGATDQADLYFSAISLPGKFAPGAAQALRIEITNQGTVPAGPFRAVYLLAGADGQNTPAGVACEAPNGLAVGATVVCENPIAFPEGLTGKSGLLIVIDDEDTVPEIDEFNNRELREIEVGI